MPPTSISIAPVETTVGTFDTINTAWLTVQIYNSDSTQTCNGRLRLQARTDTTAQSLPRAISEWLGLDGIQPGETRCADYQVAGARVVEVTATASGVGLTAVCAVNNREK